MTRPLCILLLSLFAQVCQAQVVDTLTVEKDTFRYNNKDYRYAYTVIIRDRKHNSHEGYVYKLSERSITISNVNPRYIDSSNRDTLQLLRFADTNILDIEKPRKSKSATFIVPIAPSAFFGYTLYNNTDKSNVKHRGLLAAGCIGAALLLDGVLTGIGQIIASIPRIYEVNYNRDDFNYVLRRLQQETAYKVYRE